MKSLLLSTAILVLIAKGNCGIIKGAIDLVKESAEVVLDSGKNLIHPSPISSPEHQFRRPSGVIGHPKRRGLISEVVHGFKNAVHSVDDGITHILKGGGEHGVTDQGKGTIEKASAPLNSEHNITSSLDDQRVSSVGKLLSKIPFTPASHIEYVTVKQDTVTVAGQISSSQGYNGGDDLFNQGIGTVGNVAGEVPANQEPHVVDGLVNQDLGAEQILLNQGPNVEVGIVKEGMSAVGNVTGQIPFNQESNVEDDPVNQGVDAVRNITDGIPLNTRLNIGVGVTNKDMHAEGNAAVQIPMHQGSNGNDPVNPEISTVKNVSGQNPFSTEPNFGGQGNQITNPDSHTLSSDAPELDIRREIEQ